MRWLCCPETGCSEAQYLGFQSRNPTLQYLHWWKVVPPHDNTHLFNLAMKSILKWMTCVFVLHQLSSCNMFIMQSCIHPPPYIFESVIAGAVCVVASQHWPPLTWAKDTRTNTAILSNIFHTNPNISLINLKKMMKKTPSQKTCHEATYTYTLHTYRFLNQNSRSLWISSRRRVRWRSPRLVASDIRWQPLEAPQWDPQNCCHKEQRSKNCERSSNKLITFLFTKALLNSPLKTKKWWSRESVPKSENRM